MLLAFELGPIRAFGSLHAVSLHQYPIPDRTVSTSSSSSHLLPSLSHLSRCTGRLHRLVEVDERSIAAAFKVGRVYDMSNIDIAAFVEPIIDDWSEAEDLQLLLSPPWDTSAEKIIDSIIYTLFLQQVKPHSFKIPSTAMKSYSLAIYFHFSTLPQENLT